MVTPSVPAMVWHRDEAITTISNTLSFRTHDNQDVHWEGRLQLLTNMSAGQACDRNIVLATSLVPEAGVALAWAMESICCPGDAVHLVHVVRCLTTPSEVYHPGPGNSFIANAQPHNERYEVLKAQKVINERLLPLLSPKLYYSAHIFAYTWNAPPEIVGATVLRVAADVNAICIVLAANEQAEWDPMRLGSTTKWLLRQPQPVPVALVRKLPPGATAVQAWRDAADADAED